MTPYKFLACVTLAVFSASASAARWTPDLRHLDDIPMHSLPAMQMQKAVADAVAKNNPLQFAVRASMPLTLDDGSWEQLDDGSWRWRTRIFSADAQTLNLHFSQFHLPAGASLRLYDPSGEVIAGPYTHANELGDDQLWTSVIDGETVIAELLVPAGLKDQVRLKLAEVGHGYRGFAKASTGFGASGSCETDVACPAGQPYLNQARALARITIGGNTLCSGQLVNNVRQDDTPFFLTANHCGITSSNASSVVFYWNYQNSSCGGNGKEPTSYQTQSGSVWLAGDTTSDFTLIKTAQAPSTSYNLYLAGWNAGTSVPQSGGVVHHPEGDVSKISLFNTPASSENGVTLCTSELLGACTATRKINAWSITYSQGITEPGSSGSGLYDQNFLLVGQLSGGQSACSGSTGNGKPDVYGRTNAAWAAGLKAQLDPDDTGTLQLGGKNFGSSATADASTSSSSGAVSSSSGGGGGGAFPPVTLLGLGALALLRRRGRSRRKPLA